jgi:N-acetylglutamate synthase-like GNAT family acetyltransferase
MNLNMHVRVATPRDIPALAALIEAAVRELGGHDYAEEQIESALRYVFGADTPQLIADGTYYVVEADGQIIGAGGWSQRKALYSGDQVKNGEDSLLDPARDPAKIRGFYVHPRWARRGIGRLLLQRCEQAARVAGFARLELLATLTGAPLYAAGGFTAVERVEVRMPDGVALPCIRMIKLLNTRLQAAA